MKVLALIFLVSILGGSSIAIAAEGYYTLPEIRKQATQGWHETYTDKYGRTRQVDIDIDVFGEETAPVIKACWGELQEFSFSENEPRAAIKEARIKRKGVSIYPYEDVRGMKVNLDQRYAEEYGNDLTLGEVYDFLRELLQAQGINQKYVWEQPCTFSVLYSANENTGDVLVPALYSVALWPEEFGLPILTHVADSFRMGISGPVITPKVYFDMIDRNMYSGGGSNLNVKEILAEDMPLCSVEQVIEGARKMIEEGYIQQVLSLRFGYVIYSNPDEEWGKQRSAYDMDTWYLVPSWVMECYILDDPKIDKLREYPQIWEMTINAQTGNMMDYFDKSLYGRGDARYKGFITWKDIE